MKTAVCDCLVQFTQSSLAVEDREGWVEYVDPEVFADQFSRDLYMAFCREAAKWKHRPGFEQSEATCWLDDVIEVNPDADFHDRKYEAVFVLKVTYPEEVNIQDTFLSILDEFGLTRASDPADPELGSDGYGDFES
jgi:hypothetical protein